jgi:hypothetical protein
MILNRCPLRVSPLVFLLLGSPKCVQPSCPRVKPQGDANISPSFSVFPLSLSPRVSHPYLAPKFYPEISPLWSFFGSPVCIPFAVTKSCPPVGPLMRSAVFPPMGYSKLDAPYFSANEFLPYGGSPMCSPVCFSQLSLRVVYFRESVFVPPHSFYYYSKLLKLPAMSVLSGVTP